MGLRIERADVRRFLGDLLLERGRDAERVEAARLLAEAAGEYAAMEMPELEALAHRP